MPLRIASITSLHRDAEDLAVRVLLEDVVADGVHEVRFPQPRAAVDKKGVVDLPGIVRHRQAGGVGRPVVVADDEGIEGVGGVKMGLLIQRQAGLGRGSVPGALPQQLFPLSCGDEDHLVQMIGHGEDRHGDDVLETADKIVEADLLRGNDDIDLVPADRADLGGKDEERHMHIQRPVRFPAIGLCEYLFHI